MKKPKIVIEKCGYKYLQIKCKNKIIRTVFFPFYYWNGFIKNIKRTFENDYEIIEVKKRPYYTRKDKDIIEVLR